MAETFSSVSSKYVISLVREYPLVCDHIEVRERCQIASSLFIDTRDESDRSRSNSTDQHLVQFPFVFGLDRIWVDFESSRFRESCIGTSRGS